MSDPLDAVEMREAMRNVAGLSRTFYQELVDEGFDKKQALTLTAAWLSSLMKGGGGDPLRWVDGELDDVSPEERRDLAREAALEWRAEDEATEIEDRDRADRRERDEDWRV